MPISRTFKNGKSQAVRIPAELAYDRSVIEVEIGRQGDFPFAAQCRYGSDASGGKGGQSGHDVLPEVIRRRFDAGLRNFHERYRQLVDAWNLYDNSGESPVLLGFGESA